MGKAEDGFGVISYTVGPDDVEGFIELFDGAMLGASDVLGFAENKLGSSDGCSDGEDEDSVVGASVGASDKQTSESDSSAQSTTHFPSLLTAALGWLNTQS